MDSEAIKVKKRVRDLLNTPILPQTFNLDDCTFDVPVRHYIKKPLAYREDPARSPRSERYEFSDPRKEMLTALKKGLGHRRANPSEPASVRTLLDLYTFPEQAEVREMRWNHPDADIVNADEKTTHEFILALIRAAQDNRELCEARYYERAGPERDLATEQREMARQSKWLLLGNRGIGKTIFLNYLLCKYNNLLHDHRTIWVRMDYTQPLVNVIPLEDLIRWQILTVVWKWYDRDMQQAHKKRIGIDAPRYQHWKEKEEKDMVFDLGPRSDHVYQTARGWLGSKVSRPKFRETLGNVRSKVLGRVVPEQVPDLVFQAVWYYLIADRHVGFILVIDGLDRLGLSDAQKDDFKVKVDQIKSVVMNKSALSAAYIVSARYESYKHYLFDEHLRNFRKVRVVRAPAEAIWEKKKALMQNRAMLSPKHFEFIHKMPEGTYERMQDSLCDSLLRFATYSITISLNEEKETDDISQGFRLLEHAFGDNVRLMFEALQAAAEFFMARLPTSFDQMLDSAVARAELEGIEDSGVTFTPTLPLKKYYRRWYYLFVEALMLQKPHGEFRQERYSYVLHSTEGEQQWRLHPDVKQEYLYNVFAHPSSPSSRMYPCLLAAIRALQYARHSSANAIDRYELASFLKTYFGYQKDIVEVILNQMLEAGVLAHYVDEPEASRAHLVLTRRGEFILDRLVSSLEYINLALQTAPLPYILVQEDLFPVRPYSSETFVIDNKILSTINFLRLLSDVEDRERDHFNRCVKEQHREREPNASFETYNGPGLAITGKMKERVEAAMTRIINNAYRRRDARLIRQFRDRLLEQPE